MSIKRKIITTIVALAMVATIAPVSANATTIEELLAQISTLQSQLTSLQGTTGTTTTTGSTYTACAGVTFSRTLTVGSTGADVKCLQQILNGTGYTIATTGAGSAGNETTYFGSLTLAAVKTWQTAQGWAAANQIGPKSIALLNSIVAGSSTTTTTTTTTTTPTGDGLSVKLSSDSESGEIVAGQAQAELAKFVFTNKDSSTVKVTKIKFTRGGVSSDSDLKNVYLFNGSTRLTDAASVSSGIITFNDSTGLFTIPAGSSVTVTVSADMLSTADGNVYVKLASADDITTNASAVSGSFPVKGYTQSISTGASLATVSFLDTGSGTTGTVLPNASTIDPTSDYSVWNTNASVSISSGKVKLTRLALREVGSIEYSDIENFRLFVDGVQVGDAVASLDSNGYVTFDVADNPALLKSGTRAIKVLADITNGSGKTFSFQLKTTADVTLIDSQYGVAVTPGSNASTTAFGSMRSCYDSTALTYGCTVGTGAITISKTSSSPSGDVVNEASNQVLGQWKLKANGERVKIENLTAYVAFVDTAATADAVGTNDVIKLRNAAWYADDVQVGNTFTITSVASGTEVSMGSSLIIDPSTPVILELRADIYDIDGTNELSATDTLTAHLVAGSGNAQGLSSSDTVSTGASSANTLTVAVGGLTLSKYTTYTSQTTTAPQTAYKLGHFTLTGSTTESTNITSVEADLTSTLAAHVDNLYVKIGSFTTQTKANPTATNTWAINYTLAAGTTVDVLVYGDIDSTTPETATNKTSVLVEGTTNESSTSVQTTGDSSVVGAVLSGQNIAIGSGSASATISGSTPEAAATAGNKLVTAAIYKFTASNDTYTIKEAKLTISGNDAASVEYATLSNGTNTYTAAYDSTSSWFYFTGMNIPVGTSPVSLTASLKLADVSTNGSDITTGKNVKLTMSYIKALNSQGVVKESSSSPAGVTLSSAAGNDLYVFKSIPTFTVGTVSGEGDVLSAGNSTKIYGFTVGADTAGPVSLKQLKFDISITDRNSNNPILDTFKFFRGSTEITALAIVDATGHDLTTTTSTIDETASSDVYVIFNTEETISAGSTNTYYLKARPTNFSKTTATGSDKVSVSMGTTDASSVAALDYYLDAQATGIYYLDVAAGNGDTAYSVIWSDNSATGTDAAHSTAVGHDYTDGASSADWFSGYMIKNLPLDTLTVTAE